VHTEGVRLVDTLRKLRVHPAAFQYSPMGCVEHHPMDE
jgi:hypothetical protein